MFTYDLRILRSIGCPFFWQSISPSPLRNTSVSSTGSAFAVDSALENWRHPPGSPGVLPLVFAIFSILHDNRWVLLDGDSASEHKKTCAPRHQTLRPQTNGFCSPFNVKQSKYHVFILSMFIFLVNTTVILLGDHVPPPHLLLAARPLPISTHRRCLRCHRLHQRWPRRHPTSVDFNHPKNFGPWVEVQLRWTF